MIDILMYVAGIVIAFVVGWGWHAIYMSHRRDGILTVEKTSEDEIRTVFKLTTAPENLLKNDYFVLGIERH